MIIDDLPLIAYGYYELDEIYQILIKEDNEILGHYFRNLDEIIFRTDEENIIKLRDNLDFLHKQLINFNLLPLFYELYFYVSIRLNNYKSANKYLRSFAYCIKELKKISSKEQNFRNLENHLEKCQNIINTHNLFEKRESKDTLIKFFCTKDLEILKKEMSIRVFMRASLITRPTALKHFKNMNL